MPSYISESAETRPVYDHNATRRNLYSPAEGTGTYSRALRDGSWRNAKTAAEQVEELRDAEKLQELQGQGAAAVPPK